MSHCNHWSLSIITFKMNMLKKWLFTLKLNPIPTICCTQTTPSVHCLKALRFFGLFLCHYHFEVKVISHQKMNSFVKGLESSISQQLIGSYTSTICNYLLLTTVSVAVNPFFLWLHMISETKIKMESHASQRKFERCTKKEENEEYVGELYW